MADPAGEPNAPETGRAGVPGDAAPPAYDPERFWNARLTRHFNLQGVGFERLGVEYNRWLYRLRAIAVRRAIRRAGVQLRGAHVVELGPGTGQFLRLWLDAGAHVTGLDITEVATRRLQERFPTQTFHQADITKPWPVESGSADLVTAFDVLFHIVDDGGWERALDEAARVLRPGGHLLITDLFPHAQEYRGHHQASRTLAAYERVLAAHGFRVIARRPVFVTMHPGIDVRGRRRAALAGWWWARVEEHLVARPEGGRRLGRWLFWADRVLTKVLPEGPTTELLVALRTGGRVRAPPA